jgi:hypothetical protein
VSVVISSNQDVLSREIITSEIEFICLINTRGRLVEFIGDDPIDMPSDKREMFFMKIALRSSMQKDFDEYLEHVNYCMTQRGNRKFISIPAPNNNTIFAVIKNYCDHEELVNNINQVLKSSGHLMEIFSLKEVES